MSAQASKAKGGSGKVDVDQKPERRQDPSHLAWLDLEMTGLDPSHDRILQAALIITDGQLTPLEEFCCDVWQPEHELASMSPFVRQMHDKNGLVERVRQSTIDTRKAEQQLLEIVAGWCPFGAVLCGNTIWQDRRFLERYMPGLSSYLTYRLLDVSSLKILARTWYGEKAVFKKPFGGEHDALVDIRNSIAELAHYRKTILRAP